MNQHLKIITFQQTAETGINVSLLHDKGDS